MHRFARPPGGPIRHSPPLLQNSAGPLFRRCATDRSDPIQPHACQGLPPQHPGRGIRVAPYGGRANPRSL